MQSHTFVNAGSSTLQTDIYLKKNTQIILNITNMIHRTLNICELQCHKQNNEISFVLHIICTGLNVYTFDWITVSHLRQKRSCSTECVETRSKNYYMHVRILYYSDLMRDPLIMVVMNLYKLFTIIRDTLYYSMP